MGAGGSKLKKWAGGSRVYASRTWRLEGSVLAPKGYVPVCVGVNEASCRRFMVHIKTLKDAYFSELLRKSAQEYGFRNDGVLKILFEVQDFEDLILRRYKRKTILKVKPRRSYHFTWSNKKERKKNLYNLND